MEFFGEVGGLLDIITLIFGFFLSFVFEAYMKIGLIKKLFVYKMPETSHKDKEEFKKEWH